MLYIPKVPKYNNRNLEKEEFKLYLQQYSGYLYQIPKLLFIFN